MVASAAVLMIMGRPRGANSVSLIVSGCLGAVACGLLVGSAGELSMLELDGLCLLGGLVGALLFLVAAYAYQRLSGDFSPHAATERDTMPGPRLEFTGRSALGSAPVAGAEPPPP
jgi:hypothetical protein